jgi:hypothetical protein
LTRTPSTITSKWTWGPVQSPLQPTAARDDQPLAGRQQLAEELAEELAARVDGVGVGREPSDGAGRNRQPDVRRRLAMCLAPGARASGPGPVMAVMTQVTEGGHAGVDHQHDRSTRAPVPAVGPAARNMRFASKGGGPVAAGAAGDEDPDLVSEHRGPMIAMGQPQPGRGEGERGRSG